MRIEISRYLERRFGLRYDPMSQVLITVGGSEAIDMCIRTLVQPGDEVIIPEPCFVCYEPITTLSGGVPVPGALPCRGCVPSAGGRFGCGDHPPHQAPDHALPQ